MLKKIKNKRRITKLRNEFLEKSVFFINHNQTIRSSKSEILLETLTTSVCSIKGTYEKLLSLMKQDSDELKELKKMYNRLVLMADETRNIVKESYERKEDE